MAEAEWLTSTDPLRMLGHVGLAPERKLTLFCVACGWYASPDAAVREVWSAAAEVVLAGHQPFTHFVNTVLEPTGRMPRGYRAVPGDLAAAAVSGRLPHHPANRPDADLLRDLFGNPFRPVAFDPAWRTSTAVGLAEAIYADRAFDRLPILADALQDAGCEDADVLGHCRGGGPHVRGCWVVDLVLGKQ